MTTAIAGCSDGGGGPGDNESGDNQSGDNESGDNESGGNETEDNETGGNESEGGGGSSELIESGTEIELGGEVQGWQGQAPDQIADQTNPTLVLQEGESYDITWENLDGQGHNIEIRNDNDEVVDDYSTEIMDQQGETQTLTVDEVTSEMTQYVCQPHEGTMNGEIQVESGGGGGAGNESGGNETEGNESGGNESEGNESGGNESGDSESEDGGSGDTETE
ncbi:cupredoxin domain-containing protein [Halosolutus gelatinilyticus]|uniref:cupredoxin domain-containing protein n=1 Tax=Halosolutus gelatinilyticus TaxID=2931975 RepID=UPI002AB04EFE|nr:plastocyanin/azurin family copper-binding protein [Halosolutus gelatinilyticus]